MNSWLIVAGLIMALGQACTADNQAPTAPPEVATAPAPEEGGQANSPGGLEWIRKRYARVAEMEANGLLRCDSLIYECPAEPVNGLFTYCYAGDELVRASHGRSIASHSFATEEYYYDGEEMYFAYLREGDWQFAQPPGPQTDEVVSHTRDQIREERKYFENGNLIERLFKDYELVSWEDRGPEDYPNSRQGEPVRDVLGAEVVLAQRNATDYNCPE